MTGEMTPEKADELRKPFPASAIGKLPKGGTMLDYCGHAAVTDRLLKVDPKWSWEPFAVDANGLPALDSRGNLWIRLTVCGVTRIGVGDGKNAKELIGDALRNAAMRFGVALDLWSKEELEQGELPSLPPQPARQHSPKPPVTHDPNVSARNAVKNRILVACGGDVDEAKRQVNGLQKPDSIAELAKLAEHLEQAKP